MNLGKYEITKSEAIIQILKDNNGIANLEKIYKEFPKYYKKLTDIKDWQAGLRGILYRDLKNNKIKKVGLSLYALNEYEIEDFNDVKKDKVRMHSFVEGLCVEIGNLKGFDTYTADPSSFYNRQKLSNFTTLQNFPEFTYQDIVTASKRIDVLWFNKGNFQFPKRAIEVVDSINTLADALNRTSQLIDFDLKINILTNSKYIEKVKKTLQSKPYYNYSNKFEVFSYDEVIEYYENPYSVTIF